MSIRVETRAKVYYVSRNVVNIVQILVISTALYEIIERDRFLLGIEPTYSQKSDTDLLPNHSITELFTYDSIPKTLLHSDTTVFTRSE